MTIPITKQATIERLRIQNYRMLRDVQFRDLTPLTVLLGPNGSGKSTVFDGCHPRVAHLRRFISGWYLSYLSGGTERTVPEAGSQVRPGDYGRGALC